jgi:DME family drug/metabolite transporter
MGYILAIAAAVLWSTLGLLGKYIYQYDADPLTVVTIRAVVAFATLALVLALVDRRYLLVRPRDVPFFAAYGLIGVTLNYASYFYALRWTTVTTAVILLYTYPAIVTVFAALFMDETLNWMKGLVLGLTFCGCFLVVEGYSLAAWRLNLRGGLFGLGAGVTAAAYSLMGKKALGRYKSWTAVCYAFGFGAAFLLPFRPPGVLLRTHYPWQAWLGILALAWFPTLLAYALFTTSMAHIEASQASIIATLEPVLAVLLASVVLGERVSLPQGIGAALVLGGVLLLQFTERARRLGPGPSAHRARA